MTLSTTTSTRSSMLVRPLDVQLGSTLATDTCFPYQVTWLLRSQVIT